VLGIQAPQSDGGAELKIAELVPQHVTAFPMPSAQAAYRPTETLLKHWFDAPVGTPERRLLAFMPQQTTELLNVSAQAAVVPTETAKYCVPLGTVASSCVFIAAPMDGTYATCHRPCFTSHHTSSKDETINRLAGTRL